MRIISVNFIHIDCKTIKLGASRIPANVLTEPARRLAKTFELM